MNVSRSKSVVFVGREVMWLGIVRKEGCVISARKLGIWQSNAEHTKPQGETGFPVFFLKEKRESRQQRARDGAGGNTLGDATDVQADPPDDPPEHLASEAAPDRQVMQQERMTQPWLL